MDANICVLKFTFAFIRIHSRFKKRVAEYLQIFDNIQLMTIELQIPIPSGLSG